VRARVYERGEETRYKTKRKGDTNEKGRTRWRELLEGDEGSETRGTEYARERKARGEVRDG